MTWAGKTSVRRPLGKGLSSVSKKIAKLNVAIFYEKDPESLQKLEEERETLRKELNYED